MSKVAVAIFSVVLVYTCVVFCDSGVGASPVASSPGSSSSPNRKVRILSPALSKLYRILRNGGGLSPDDEDLFGEDETYFQKRQYDDYGHMRFGKRNPKDFDDYGHMRFGKK